ncbi:hypothetical protein [Thermococcus peptonophilus]|uniref:hypothetical protein n=1 Tax=Thermococcus peptonophilus TaxID=53952 RepID=UPI00373FDD9D
MGKTRGGDGEWIDGHTKAFFQDGKLVGGAVVIGDIKRAFSIEKELKEELYKA